MNKKINKSIITLIITTLVFTLVYPLNNVSANSHILKESIDIFEDLLIEENIELLDLEYTADKVSFEVSVVNEDDENSEEVTTIVDFEPGNNTMNVTVQEEFNEVRSYSLVIESLDERGLVAKYTDLATGKEYQYNSSIASPTIVIAIPWGISLSAKAIAALYAAGSVVLIGGLTYIEVNTFINNEKNKKYNHYIATINGGKLHISSGLSKSKAESRLRNKQNTWSTSKTNAQAVAKGASPIGKVTAPEISNGKNMVWHYHPISGYDKNGKSIRMESAHAFYGQAN